VRHIVKKYYATWADRGDLIFIGAVAGLCGFSNQFHFCRLFKEKTGLTPTEYMKQNRIYKI
jgi:AraC-like DNA-binding protein